MSDSLRVRLEFRQFESKNFRNSLLSFKKSQTKDVKSLEKLIQNRFEITEPFCLNIDNFVLEDTEPIDILRDNDLIVVEPKGIVLKTNFKTEFKQDIGPQEVVIRGIISSTPVPKKAKLEKSSKSFTKSDVKAKKMKPNERRESDKYKSKKYLLSDSDDSSCDDLIVLSNQSKDDIKHKLKTYSKVSDLTEIDKSCSETKSIVDLETDSNSESNTSMCLSDANLFSSCNTSHRKAFEAAIIKNKPQTQRPKPTNTDSEKKPKLRKRLTQEALEPVDEFSPIIILEKIKIPESDTNCAQINVDPIVRKQSARKSFPSLPFNNGLNGGNNSSKNENKSFSLKTLDCGNCEPLSETPQIGDIIAFKILTLSKDGNGYEASEFNKGKVLNVSSDNTMVDILLEDGIKRKNKYNLLNSINNNEQQLIIGIHVLKINWSTVLEPKLIQRSFASK